MAVDTVGCTNDEGDRLIAWDGLEMAVPAQWELAGYRSTRRIRRLELEDDCRLTLEAEWRTGAGVNECRDSGRAHAAAVASLGKRLTPVRTRTLEVGVAAQWSSTLMRTTDGRLLGVAFRGDHEAGTVCSIQAHFARATMPSEAESAFGAVLASVRLRDAGVIRWCALDFDFGVDSCFRLSSSRLEAGRKLLAFEWRLRRLLVWSFSLADVLLSGRSPAQWAAEFLNASRLVRGPLFHAAAAGVSADRRRGRYPIGHFEEIGRWCFRYRVGLRHDPENNRLLLWLYHYRGETDVEVLRTGFSLF